jgi:hypothetical protein
MRCCGLLAAPACINATCIAPLITLQVVSAALTHPTTAAAAAAAAWSVFELLLAHCKDMLAARHQLQAHNTRAKYLRVAVELYMHVKAPRALQVDCRQAI